MVVQGCLVAGGARLAVLADKAATLRKRWHNKGKTP